MQTGEGTPVASTQGYYAQLADLEMEFDQAEAELRMLCPHSLPPYTVYMPYIPCSDCCC